MYFYLSIALGMVAFAATTYGAVVLAKRVCRSIEPFADGPPPGEPPVFAMYGLAIAVGAALAYHHTSVSTLLCAALINGCLIAIWWSDVRCGIIPDVFSLPPLAIMLIYHIYTRDFWSLVIVAAVTFPFLFQAWRSKGLGMGWGDVKLAAFGSALLGQSAFLTIIFSCFIAYAQAKIANRMQEPMAFGAHLVIGFELGMILFAGTY